MADEDPNAVRAWWAENPMTYGTVHGTTSYGQTSTELGSRSFFDQVDETFYGWNPNLHDERKFDRLFPYQEFAQGARVLEIGCGMGTMAMNWALNGSTVTAVDLNPTSIAQTRRRFELMNLQADIRQMDGNRLEFSDASFDYVYSWGVLHHSPNLAKSLAEMLRVLRPGGKFGLMLYSRDSILYRYRIQLLEGFLHLENRFLSPLELASRYTDAAESEGNPHTWPVTDAELRAMLAGAARNVELKRFGEEMREIFKYLLPGVSRILPEFVIQAWIRRFGWSVWAAGNRI